MLTISLKMQPLSKVSEREERESSTNEYEPFKVPRESFPTSRAVRDDLTDCPCLNSNGTNAKSTVVRVACWVGRTVHQDPADCPPGRSGLSARAPRTVRRWPADRQPGPPELRTVLYDSRLISDRSPKTRRLAARKRFFSKSFDKTLYIQ
jgi:hypothetical protein